MDYSPTRAAIILEKRPYPLILAADHVAVVGHEDQLVFAATVAPRRKIVALCSIGADGVGFLQYATVLAGGIVTAETAALRPP